MWFFMITSYILILLSAVGLILIGINHYINIWPTQHISFDLFVSLIFIATQTLIIFFFVKTSSGSMKYEKTATQSGNPAQIRADKLE